MAGRSSRRQGSGSDRIRALVDEKLKEGLQYEALQLYRGVVARKSARGDHDAAISIAEQGIGVLLRAHYADSATELGNVLMSILDEREMPPTEERIAVIKRLSDVFEDAKRAEILAEEDRQAAELMEGEGAAESSSGREGGENGSQDPDLNGKGSTRGRHSVGTLQVIVPVATNGMVLRVRMNWIDQRDEWLVCRGFNAGLREGRFLKAAVDWTAARGRRVVGDPELCALLGRCLWNEGDIDRGMKYLVLGERPQELCDLIMQDVGQGRAREVAVAKGVLQFAGKSSLRDANALLTAYKGRVDGKPRGLLAFCGMLLKTCEYDAGPVFQKLLEAYGSEVSGDKAMFGAVETIAMVYFGIRLRPPSMLDNIVGIFSGMSK